MGVQRKARTVAAALSALLAAANISRVQNLLSNGFVELIALCSWMCRAFSRLLPLTVAESAYLASDAKPLCYFSLPTRSDRAPFVGLLVAQFLAAFNDQAIHASAMFFAIHRKTLTQADAISLMPILFYAPWAIFCTVAGYTADRFSKQKSLIFWKIAEIGITLVALSGFYLGSVQGAG